MSVRLINGNGTAPSPSSGPLQRLSGVHVEPPVRAQTTNVVTVAEAIHWFI